jgi:Ca2+-transporting ATPase
VTDGLPALALGIEPIEKNIMGRKPRDPKEKVLNRESLSFILFAGGLMAAATLLQFYIELSSEGLEKARTVAFTTIVMVELFIAMSARSNQPLHRIGFFSNRKLMLAIFSSVMLQLAVIYVPLLNPFFDTVPMTAGEWISVLSVSLFVFAAVEMRKFAMEKGFLKGISLPSAKKQAAYQYRPQTKETKKQN